MAGTLVISTLSDGTNSTSSTNCIQGSAKAWVNFDGSVATPTIRTSYNVSSITKPSTGQYIVNFTNAFSDANYVCMCSSGDPAYTFNFAASYVAAERTTSAIKCISMNDSATAYTDIRTALIAVFR